MWVRMSVLMPQAPAERTDGTKEKEKYSSQWEDCGGCLWPGTKQQGVGGVAAWAALSAQGGRGGKGWKGHRLD